MSIQRELKQKTPFSSPAHEASVSLLRTADLIRRTIGILVEPQGITMQQFNVLRILRGAGESGLPTLEIAERMVEQTPGITRLLDRLEAKGLVGRERCRSDRRQVLCTITNEGLELLDQVDEPIRRAEKKALAALSEHQLKQLLSLLDLARNGLHATLDARRAEHSEEAS